MYQSLNTRDIVITNRSSHPGYIRVQGIVNGRKTSVDIIRENDDDISEATMKQSLIRCLMLEQDQR